MPISTKVAEGIHEVDVIIAGAGTAGCVVAGRLAAADPELSTLLIEGGENNAGKEDVRNGAQLLEHLTPVSRTAIFNVGKESKALGGRAVVVPSGGLLGGGSSINIMLEDYHGPGDKHHEDWLSTAVKLGYKEYTDLEDPESVNEGWERALKYSTPDGSRADAAHAYVQPLLEDGEDPNLHVLCESKVVRVLFDDNKRAVGVEYITNPAYQAQTNLTQTPNLTIKATKLVVVSAGACGTPQVLERSGVGNPSILKAVGVPVVAEVPGVGENYDDHTLIIYPFATNLGPDDTLDQCTSGSVSAQEYTNKGMIGWNGCDTHGKFRPTEEEVQALGPAFKSAWEKDYKSQPNRPLMMSATLAGFLGDHSTVPAGQYFSTAAYFAYSYSRGYLHITGPNYEDQIDFDPGYLSDKDGLDVAMNIWAYKRLPKIMRSTSMFTGELQIAHPMFPEGSAAACVNDVDSKSVVADPKYTAEDDKAIEKFIRGNVGSCWHSLGTAKMAPKEQNGVVDEKLNVYGVTGLKVIDLSIAPGMVAANTNNTAYVVGEKGAEIILAEFDAAREGQ